MQLSSNYEVLFHPEFSLQTSQFFFLSYVPRTYIPFSNNTHALSDNTRQRSRRRIASGDAAFPSSPRLYTPCEIAARRKSERTIWNFQSGISLRPLWAA